MSTAAPANAPCAVHPEQPSAFICERCGAFACDACRADPGGTLCQACEARRSAELATPVRVVEVLGAAARLPLEHWWATLAYFGIGVVPSILWIAADPWKSPPPDVSDRLTNWIQASPRDPEALAAILRPLLPRMTVGMLVSFLEWTFWLAATGGLTLVIAAAVRRQPPDGVRCFSNAVRRLHVLLAANLLVYLVAIVGTVACVLPGLAALIAGSMVDPAVLIGGRGPWGAYRVSARWTWRALAPVLVLTLAYWVGNLAVTSAFDALTKGRLPGMPANVSDLVNHVIEYACALPVIAGVAYVYVRMDSSART